MERVMASQNKLQFALLATAVLTIIWLSGFVIGVYSTFNHTPFDFVIFPVLEHYGLI